MDISERFLAPVHIRAGWRVIEADEDLIELTKDGRSEATFTIYSTPQDVQKYIAQQEGKAL